MSSLFIGIILFIFIQLWTVVYGTEAEVIEGFTLGMMIWYLVLTESIVTSPGRLIEDIGAEVQSGTIAQHLLKPYHYLLFKYVTTMGSTVLRFVMTFIIGALLAFFFVGGIKVTLWSVPIIILSLFLALTLHYAFMAAIGVMAFWLEDAESLYLLYQKTIFVFGGMFMPLDIFPAWLESVSKALPFSYVAYYPAHLAVRFDVNEAISVVGMQIVWISVLSVIAWALYRFCVKRITINGG